MREGIAFRAALGVYYLALGTWFGATVMMAIAAATTFRTLREHGATWPDAPASVEQPHRYLAGQVVNGGFSAMSLLQGVCAAIVLVIVVLQLTVWRRGLRRGFAHPLRLALLGFALLLFAADLAYTRSRMGELRNVRYDEGVASAERARAGEAFDTLHRVSERMLAAAALAVAAATIATPFAVGLRTGLDDGERGAGRET